jgi:hypothetical protein
MAVAIPAVAEVPAPVVVRLARAAHGVVRVKVTLAAVAAMRTGKVSRAAVIVLPGRITRQVALSQTR